MILPTRQYRTARTQAVRPIHLRYADGRSADCSACGAGRWPALKTGVFRRRLPSLAWDLAAVCRILPIEARVHESPGSRRVETADSSPLEQIGAKKADAAPRSTSWEPDIRDDPLAHVTFDATRAHAEKSRRLAIAHDGFSQLCGGCNISIVDHIPYMRKACVFSLRSGKGIRAGFAGRGRQGRQWAPIRSARRHRRFETRSTGTARWVFPRGVGSGFTTTGMSALASPRLGS